MARGTIIFDANSGVFRLVPNSPLQVKCPVCRKDTEIGFFEIKPDGKVSSLKDLANKKFEVAVKCSHCGEMIGEGIVEIGDIDDIISGPASKN